MPTDCNCRATGVFESAHSISILIYISLHEGCLKNEIYDHISHTATMPKKLDDLVSSGLVRAEALGRATGYSLTDSGRAVSGHLMEILRIMDPEEASRLSDLRGRDHWPLDLLFSTLRIPNPLISHAYIEVLT
mgnify:FL=1